MKKAYLDRPRDRNNETMINEIMSLKQRDRGYILDGHTSLRLREDGEFCSAARMAASQEEEDADLLVKVLFIF